MSSILERLAAVNSLHASELAAEFGVSAATLRRDLQMLEDQHLLSRTHAVRSLRRSRTSYPFAIAAASTESRSSGSRLWQRPYCRAGS